SVVPPSEASRCSPAMISFVISLWRRDDDPFRFQVVLQGLRPVLASDAAKLHTTERHLVVTDMQRVNPDVTRLQTLGRLARFRQILRPHRRTQSPLRLIGQVDPFGEVFDLEHWKHWAKSLLSHDARIMWGVGQYRRQVEEALLEFGSIRTLAPDD